MAGRIEPPVLFTPDVTGDPARLAKALQMFVDALNTSLSGVDVDRQDALEGLSDDLASSTTDTATEIAEEEAEAVTSSITETLAEAGVGAPDGVAPTGSVTPEVVPGIGNLIFIRFMTMANSSSLTYEIHVSTVTGFTPDGTTLAGTVILPGISGQLAAYPLRVFPSTHLLAGEALNPDTDYFVKIVPSDEDGAAPGPYPEASGSPILLEGSGIEPGAITNEQIADGVITEVKQNWRTHLIY